LQTLAIDATPGYPQLKKILPILADISLTLSKIASLYAPTIKVRVPAYAAIMPPETGASIYVIWCSLPFL
jgi:hypothetical protein